MTGLTPPEFAARHINDSEEIVGVLNSACATKRKRRGTPVKERAVKAGVSLPPTPDGIRRFQRNSADLVSFVNFTTGNFYTKRTPCVTVVAEHRPRV